MALFDYILNKSLKVSNRNVTPIFREFTGTLETTEPLVAEIFTKMFFTLFMSAFEQIYISVNMYIIMVTLQIDQQVINKLAPLYETDMSPLWQWLQ